MGGMGGIVWAFPCVFVVQNLILKSKMQACAGTRTRIFFENSSILEYYGASNLKPPLKHAYRQPLDYSSCCRRDYNAL